MKPRAAQLIACPIDRTPLELVVWEASTCPLSPADAARAKELGISAADLETEVVTGALLNRARKVAYPIHRGVPRLLSFGSAVASEWEAQHGERLRREFPGFALPSAEPMPGEHDVLRTFSTEWVEYDWTGDTYWGLTPEAFLNCMAFTLDIERHPVRGKRVLEVGIGIGATADWMSRANGAEVVGMDLGYAVDAAHRNFGANPFLHVVQGSAFAPPFADGAFDFVYSFGVLHHTFSTETAFERIRGLPKADGRLFVWVYSPWDEERTLKRRMLMRLEKVLRPVIWRLHEPWQTLALAPVVPLYLVHQNVLERSRGKVNYGWREAIHAARDRFSPRYIHRHTDEELAGWFEAAGYHDLEVLSGRQRPEWVPEAWTACAGVAGTRA